MLRRDGARAEVELQGTAQRVWIESDVAQGNAVSVLLRPERIRLSAAPLTDGNVVAGAVAASSFTGSAIDYDVELAGGLRLRVMAPPELDVPRGTVVWLVLRDARGLAVDQPLPAS